MLWLIAAIPILLIIVLLVFFKMPSTRVMPLSYIVTILIAAFVWQMSYSMIAASTIKGVFAAFEIILIVFGALMLLDIMRKSGAVHTIDYMLSRVSRDRRIQTVLIAWFFVSFIEGAAGFGTPAALAAPLLVALGFSPFGAVMVSLIGDSTATSFGAVGTPVLLGITKALDSPSYVLQDNFLQLVTVKSALIHAIAGSLVPIIMVLALTHYHKDMKAGWKFLPYALVAGLCFTIPYYFTAFLFGPEFPSLVGAFIGLPLYIGIIKLGFHPKIWRFPHDTHKKLPPGKVHWMKALAPYLIIIFLLIVSRTTGFGAILKKLTFDYTGILGTNLSYALSPLFSPGFLFIITALIAMKILGTKDYEIFNTTFHRIKKPFFVLVFIIGLVQVLINSGINKLGLDSMPLMLAKKTAVLGQTYIIASPLLGALGSFMTGSNTVSNLFFTPFQYETALAIGLPVILIVALQNVGGAIGNMVAIHNLVAASATVNLKNREGDLIKYNIIPLLIYALLAGVLAYFL